MISATITIGFVQVTYLSPELRRLLGEPRWSVESIINRSEVGFGFGTTLTRIEPPDPPPIKTVPFDPADTHAKINTHD